MCIKYFKKWVPDDDLKFLHLCLEEFTEDHQNTTT